MTPDDHLKTLACAVDQFIDAASGTSLPEVETAVLEDALTEAKRHLAYSVPADFAFSAQQERKD